MACAEVPSVTSSESLYPLLALKEAIKCSETSSKKTDSPNREYFEKLLSKGMDAKIEEFLKLWEPGKKEYQDDPYIFECEKTSMGTLSLSSTNELLEEKCSPDVLYSWGPVVKLKNMMKNMPDDKTWSGAPNSFILNQSNSSENGKLQGTLFMALTPAASYAYGPVLMRIKLKKKTPFKVMAYDSMVEVGVGSGNVREFVLNNSSLIESWSFGTEEIYDELVRDLMRINQNKRADLLFTDEKSDLKGIGQLFTGAVDGVKFDEETLKSNLLELINVILNNKGQVIYQKGECHNPDVHYSTEKPTWFNPE
jgi:hypothetical protein